MISPWQFIILPKQWFPLTIIFLISMNKFPLPINNFLQQLIFSLWYTGWYVIMILWWWLEARPRLKCILIPHSSKDSIYGLWHPLPPPTHTPLPPPKEKLVSLNVIHILPLHHQASAFSSTTYDVSLHEFSRDDFIFNNSNHRCPCHLGNSATNWSSKCWQQYFAKVTVDTGIEVCGTSLSLSW